MITRMRNALLKLSPTFKLHKQVEYWYSNTGLEDTFTNPLEIVRSILCAESTVSRPQWNLIRESLCDIEVLTLYDRRTLSLSMSGADSYFDRNSGAVTRNDVLVPSMKLDPSTGALVTALPEALIQCGTMAPIRRYRPLRESTAARGINAPILGTPYFLDATVAELSRTYASNVFNMSTHVAGMQFFILETSFTYAHCAYKSVGAFALRAVPEQLHDFISSIVKAVPISQVLGDLDSCFTRQSPDEVLAVCDLTSLDTIEVLSDLVRVRSPELQAALLLTATEFEELCLNYTALFPPARRTTQRVRESLSDLRIRCAALCHHFDKELTADSRPLDVSDALSCVSMMRAFDGPSSGGVVSQVGGSRNVYFDWQDE